MVDNLSRGRIGVSFASGWHPNDFAFAPGSFEERHELLVDGIEKVRRLWRGEPLDATDGNGKPMQVRLFPMPSQRELPIWLTGASQRTFELAGRLGSGVSSDSATFNAHVPLRSTSWAGAGTRAPTTITDRVAAAITRCRRWVIVRSARDRRARAGW